LIETVREQDDLRTRVREEGVSDKSSRVGVFPIESLHSDALVRGGKRERVEVNVPLEEWKDVRLVSGCDRVTTKRQHQRGQTTASTCDEMRWW
jgi:hypothetical protein